jgi:molecular chaperone GrpE
MSLLLARTAQRALRRATLQHRSCAVAARARPTAPARGGRRLLSTKDADAASEAEAPDAEEVPDAAAAALETVTQERNDLKDQLLRAIAEQENTRRIARRDVQAAKDFSSQSFAKSLLDVSDSLGYALDASKGDDASLATLIEGVELTRNQLVKAFGSQGVEEYGGVGDAFDPGLHEALFEYEDADQEPGCVGQVVKTGFTMKGRTIRAAQVGVVKK